jgi:hypothetical protein
MRYVIDITDFLLVHAHKIREVDRIRKRKSDYTSNTKEEYVKIIKSGNVSGASAASVVGNLNAANESSNRRCS